MQSDIISNFTALSKLKILLFFLGDQGEPGPPGNQGPPGAHGIGGRKGLRGDIGFPGQKGRQGRVLNILGHINCTKEVSSISTYFPQ